MWTFPQEDKCVQDWWAKDEDGESHICLLQIYHEWHGELTEIKILKILWNLYNPSKLIHTKYVNIDDGFLKLFLARNIVFKNILYIYIYNNCPKYFRLLQSTSITILFLYLIKQQLFSRLTLWRSTWRTDRRAHG